ncbi:MAG: hypothetical protein PHP44_11140 [Kiritimatiellae bacterium]|nr:hypothetical protein [Kiritimatiellia bacterium]
MKTTAQHQRAKKESAHVATTATTTPCDIEVILNHRRTIALSRRDGLFFVDDADTLQETGAALRVVLDKVQRLIRAGS